MYIILTHTYTYIRGVGSNRFPDGSAEPETSGEGLDTMAGKPAEEAGKFTYLFCNHGP